MVTLPGDINIHAPAGWEEWLVLLLAGGLSIWLFDRAAGRGFAVGAGLVGTTLGFAFVGHNAIPVAITTVAAALAFEQARKRRDFRVEGSAFALQALVILAGLLAYSIARMFIEGSESTAIANARDIVAFQEGLGLFFEPDLQGWVLEREWLMRLFNTIYSFLFLAVVVWALLWLYVRDQANFRLLRNALGISVVLAVITIALYPVAPPRLLPDLGIVDTVVYFGREHDFTNEFAAVPSLHVGWMVLVGFVFARSLGGWRGAAIGLVPGSVMSVTVIVTGNHYWIDGVVGAAYSLGPALVLLYWRPVIRYTAITTRVIASNRRLQLSLLALGGLETYLLVAQVFNPGFTDFWGYLVFQMAAIMILLTAGEVVFRHHGGISWQTHAIATVCSYLDVLGTDGNLYARIDEYDKLTHFMGVAAITSGAYDCFRGMYNAGSRKWVAEDRLVAAVSVGIAVGIGWEVYEYIGDNVFNTSRIGGAWDTTNDIVSDTLGAMAAGIWLWWAEKQDSPVGSTALPEAGPSGPGR